MLINEHSLDLVFRGFKTVYTDAHLSAETHWDEIAMAVPSSGSDETYGWLGQFPQLREWIGQRHVHNLQLGYASTDTLDATNYAAARAAMMNYCADGGRIPGINPTTLVVSPAPEDAALHVLNTEAKDSHQGRGRVTPQEGHR